MAPLQIHLEKNMEKLSGFLGIIAILAMGYLFSSNRRAIRLKTVAWGLSLQFLFALLVLRTSAGQATFRWMGEKINRLLSFAGYGSSFVFGQLGTPGNTVAIFAFQVLPTIIFIAALFAILYYLGVMQVIVLGFAKVMTRFMGASGAESLNVAASIFMGQTEAPLTIRPFLSSLTRSELMTVMTSGMAHISGGIMAAYIAFGIEARHLITAVIMTAPGTIMMAKMFVPETEEPKTAGTVSLRIERTDVNVIDAAARGTGEGMRLALNVGAMLISFLALIALVNALLGIVPLWGGQRLSLEWIFGRVAAPLAWLMGVPWKDAFEVGNLLGTRLVLNELIAFSRLGAVKANLDPRSFVIATFALCGFANFSSIGIQIGGIGALAPERKHDLAKLGLRAVAAGTLANYLSASIAGMLM
jgi:CNT family concentrative nucleoside transporter